MSIIYAIIRMGLSEIALMFIVKALLIAGMPLMVSAPFILFVGTVSIVAGGVLDIIRSI